MQNSNSVCRGLAVKNLTDHRSRRKNDVVVALLGTLLGTVEKNIRTTKHSAETVP